MKKFIVVCLLAVMMMTSFAFAEEGSGTAGQLGGTNSDFDEREDVRDEKEDIRDLKEDKRDRKENLIDASNADRAACIRKCQAAGGQNCQARCTNLDKAENVLDRKENKLDRAEDRLDKREDVREKWMENRDELKEKLRLQDPEKLRRLAALDNAAIKLQGLSADEIERFAKLSRENQQDLINLTKAELRERLKAFNFKRVTDADDLKDRIIPNDRLQNIRQKYKNAHDRYEQAKDEYQDAKEAYRKAVSDGDAEAALEHAKEVLSKSADSIIAHLERLIAKIEENENIDEERAAEIIENIQPHIDTVMDIKADIDAATTKEEVRAAAKALKEEWNALRHKVRMFAENVIEARVKGIINQAEILEKKLDRALSHMDAQNITVDVDAEVEEFNTLVADAKSLYEGAQELLSQARDSDDPEETKSLVDEAHELLKEARDKLKDAYDLLREIVTKIKESGQELDIDSSVEVEMEDDDSDDEDESDDSGNDSESDLNETNED